MVVMIRLIILFSGAWQEPAAALAAVVFSFASPREEAPSSGRRGSWIMNRMRFMPLRRRVETATPPNFAKQGSGHIFRPRNRGSAPGVELVNPT